MTVEGSDKASGANNSRFYDLDAGDSAESLKIVPIGGLGEIGKNTMAFIYGDDMILVDAGLAFPTDEMIGVDLVLPDISFLVKNQHKLRGLAITHGHEDHIGGIPYILKEMRIPKIYGPALALGLIESKLKEADLEDRTELALVKPRQRVKIGCFEVEFIRCTHSIADAFSLIIRTPIGTVVHTGDFKFDFTPVDGELYDFASLANASEEGIILLLSDSTNTEREGFTPSEKTVWKKINEVFASARQRIIVTTFASNVHRVKQVLNAAMWYGRKVAILGRSMHKFAELARELGYASYPDDLLIPVEQVKEMPPDQVVILTTGSQGEPLSALTRIANDEHKLIKIEPGDTVVLSATPIPGNERLVSNTINKLFLAGAEVVYGRNTGVHVSGHACREEQKLMLNICNPQLFMPVHGEYRMLVGHADLAVQCGVDQDGVFVMENGDVLEVSLDQSQKKAVGRIAGKVESGIRLVDSNRSWIINEEIVDDRRLLSEDGLVTVVASVDKDGSPLAGPDISIRGIILPRGVPAEEFVLQIQGEVLSYLKSKKPGMLKAEALEAHLLSYFGKEMRAQPLVLVRIHTPVDSGVKTKAAKGESAETSGN